MIKISLMKKTLLIFIAAFSALQLQAQNINPDGDNIKGRMPKAHKQHKPYDADSLLQRWCIDVNATAGILTQQYTANDLASHYTNAINQNISQVKFENGGSYGIDAQVGYFFGRKKHFGIGTGLMYMYQQGTATIDNFHIEYQSTDYQGNIFRQSLTANGGVKEKLNVSNFNIPLLFKYKKRFSQHIGFTADAGLLFNLQLNNAYSTNSTFDYEAIYKYSLEAGGGTVYDNSSVPGTSDLLITKAQYLNNHTAGNVNDYFNSLHAQGYNVGLGVKPGNNSGNVSYMSGSVGFLVRPAISFYLSDKVALNLGAYYLYQNFNHTASNAYRLTDKVGEYNSMLNSVSTAQNNVYGISFGVRYFFGKMKDSDGDGVPDKFDRCPLEAGLKQFKGCPDKDGDGIPDIDDACPDVPGLAEFNGCPDTDGDGIPDNEDACPYVPGLEKFDGCPDKDGDGIPDKDDACPLKAGPAKYQGCPDTDGDGIPDNLDQCPTVPGPESNHGCPIDTKEKTETKEETVNISTPILFEDNSTVIKKRSYRTLQEAVDQLKDNKKISITVNGYASLEGTKKHNFILSQRRALAVKNYLQKKGVNTKNVYIIGHGSNDPVASNKTEAGREQNRRAVIKVNHRKAKKATKSTGAKTKTKDK